MSTLTDNLDRLRKAPRHNSPVISFGGILLTGRKKTLFPNTMQPGRQKCCQQIDSLVRLVMVHSGNNHIIVCLRRRVKRTGDPALEQVQWRNLTNVLCPVIKTCLISGHISYGPGHFFFILFWLRTIFYLMPSEQDCGGRVTGSVTFSAFRPVFPSAVKQAHRSLQLLIQSALSLYSRGQSTDASACLPACAPTGFCY